MHWVAHTPSPPPIYCKQYTVLNCSNAVQHTTLQCTCTFFLVLQLQCILLPWTTTLRKSSLKAKDGQARVRPRFFDQVGHETMYACSGSKHFVTKPCHRQTYHNYEQPPETSQNLYFQSHFSMLKIGRICPKKCSMNVTKPCFWKFWFLRYFIP